MTFSSRADTAKILAQKEVADAEIITIALTAILHFGGNFDKSWLILHELGLIR